MFLCYIKTQSSSTPTSASGLRECSFRPKGVSPHSGLLSVVGALVAAHGQGGSLQQRLQRLGTAARAERERVLEEAGTSDAGVSGFGGKEVKVQLFGEVKASLMMCSFVSFTSFLPGQPDHRHRVLREPQT